MTFEKYSKLAANTDRMGHSKNIPSLAYYALGLSGESGETVDAIKKWFRKKDPKYLEQAREELGDTLWYLARLAAKLDIRLSAVAKQNLRKLAKRHKNWSGEGQ